MIDSSQLIKDERDILRTNRVGCMIRDQVYHIILHSPTNSFLGRIFEKTRLRPEMEKERKILGGNRCLMTQNPMAMAELIRSDFFIMGSRSNANTGLVTFKMLDGFFKSLWLLAKPVHEYRLVVYYTLRQKSNKETISRM